MGVCVRVAQNHAFSLFLESVACAGQQALAICLCLSLAVHSSKIVRNPYCVLTGRAETEYGLPLALGSSLYQRWRERPKRRDIPY